jgi:hypothetical protein
MEQAHPLDRGTGLFAFRERFRYGVVVVVVEEEDELEPELEELPKLELPMAVDVLAADVPMLPVFPLTVCMSLRGS